MGGLFNLAGAGKDIGLAVRRFLVFILPVLVIVGAIGVNVVGGMLRPEPEKTESDITAAPVLVATAEQQEVRLSVLTQGEVRPRTEIDMVPQVAGKISTISDKFIEGGAFETGELLIGIEAREYELRVVQARANVAQARTRLASEQAEADSARRDWEELGQDAQDISPLALREPQLDEARAALASAQAALGEAELALERTQIRAPFDGRVKSKMVDFGQYITPGTPLGEIYATRIMDVPLPLTDEELGRLGLDVGFTETAARPGPNVTLSTTVAGRQREWTGRLVRTDGGYDTTTRVLFGYVEVEDPFGTGSDNGTPLAPGLFVSARIEGRSIGDSVVVPRTALRGNDQVFIAREDNTMEIRTVSVASSDREQAIITAGLSPGERVITSPVRGAANDMKIEIVDRAAIEEEEEAEAEDASDLAAAETPEVGQ